MHNPHLKTPSGKPRARALKIPFSGTPGPLNAITDVPGTEVGYVTLIEGQDVRTGVTAIHPRGKQSGEPLVAGFHSQNGNGEMTGVTWIEESGTFAGPIAITNTHAVGIAHAGIVSWAVQHHPAMADMWLLPVAAETWDGYLNDINGHHITEDLVVEALDAAADGPIEEGAVGGGTGMTLYDYKGGSGTASRIVRYGDAAYTVGVFVQANFGSRHELTIAGKPVGALFPEDNPQSEDSSIPPGAGSVIVIIATDAPLMPPQCKALARRATLGLARTGTTGSHFSGDLFLAYSTANRDAFSVARYKESRAHLDTLTFIPWQLLDPFFAATVEAVEEAVVNVLVAAEEMAGYRGHRIPGLPRDQVAALF